MKYKIIILILSAIFSTQVQAQTTGLPETKLVTRMDSVSYALGFALSGILKNQVGITDTSGLDYTILNDAMQRTIANDTFLMNETMARYILGRFAEEQMEKQQAEEQKTLGALIAKNEKEGAEFLEKNKTAAGVVTTASGLQYKIIKAGKGRKPKADSHVKVHYTGKFLNGKVFDSSIERGEPAVFEVTQVIPGWTEAIQLMPVGSKWELYIPSILAYDKGNNETIPAGSTLIFEVELISIEKGE